MSRSIVLACVIGLFLTLFGSVIFAPRALIYRDSAHFYYPLFQLVQQEWSAGRVPLWNPYEDAGQPLLGNPTASVFYPLKILLFLPFAYASLYKAYILLHVLLCAATAYWMARHWGGSVGAAGVCAISYAFSGAVFFQYANVVFLCGAAWIPVALITADCALRQRRWIASLGLAVVLALQVLGGDPEAAYLCGLLVAGYALLLSWRERQARRRAAQDSSRRARHPPGRWLPLAVAAVAAMLLAAVQVLPSWQLVQRSVRAAYDKPRNIYELATHWAETGRFETAGLLGGNGTGPHPIHEFSTGPWRWPEFIWPNVNGRSFPVNTRWIGALRDETTVWVPSLYMGLLPIVLAAVAWRWRHAETHVRWLQLLVAFGLLGAMGRFGAVWLLRIVFGSQFAGQPGEPGSLGDEVGGPYWLMTVLLPGFVNFRFPSKLLVFAALGTSGLAAAGWDRALNSDTRRLCRGLAFALGAGGLLVVGVCLGRWAILERLRQVSELATDSYYGPLDVKGAWSSIAGAGLHTAAVALMAWGLLKLYLGSTDAASSRGPRRWIAPLAPALLLLLLAADLAVANRWLVLTGPQSTYASVPRALEIIRRAETQRGDGQPYRIFRTLLFAPLHWAEHGSTERHREGFRWERDTLSPKYGLPYGVQYTLTPGTITQYDYEFFLAPWRASRAEMVQRYRVPVDERNVPRWTYYPQRGFDDWNTRYFILPWRRTSLQGRPLDDDENRGVVSFLFDLSGMPAPRLFPATPEQEREAQRLDFQVVYNPDALPRAWIVHRLYTIDPVTGKGTADRRRVMERLVVDGAPNLRDAALVELKNPSRVTPFDQPTAETAAESCRVVRYSPQQVEVAVTLNSPGMLVLADAYYPGWHAEVDGRPAEIFRVNRMMRGVGLAEGEHTVVFAYRPASFWWGSRISLVAWGALVLLFVGVALRRHLRRAAQGRLANVFVSESAPPPPRPGRTR